MRKILALVTLLAMVLVSREALSQEEILYLNGIEPIFSISSPIAWKTSKKNGVLLFQSKDKGQQCWILQTQLDAPSQGVEKAAIFAKKYLSFFEGKKEETFTKNKISYLKISGVGKLGNKDGNATVLFFKPSKKAKEKVVVLIYFEPSYLAEQEASLKEIVSSIYPR